MRSFRKLNFLHFLKNIFTWMLQMWGIFRGTRPDTNEGFWVKKCFTKSIHVPGASLERRKFYQIGIKYNALQLIVETNFGHLYGLHLVFNGLFKSLLKFSGSWLSADTEKSKIGQDLTKLQPKLFWYQIDASYETANYLISNSCELWSCKLLQTLQTIANS